jgi:drug/metabolite transporter (DMT)-like permease
LAVVFLGERLSVREGFWAALIITGALLLGLKEAATGIENSAESRAPDIAVI